VGDIAAVSSDSAVTAGATHAAIATGGPEEPEES
jgi:hypothetical protein